MSLFQGRFALDCAAKILPYYKGYFGSAYPLPKLDLIAIPDFASGEGPGGTPGVTEVGGS